MQLDGGENFIIDNFIFTGFYSRNINGNYQRLFNLSSPDNPISNFTQPYGATLSNNGQIVAVGQFIKPNCLAGNRSGVLYYSDSSQIYGACHGLNTGNNGNFPTYYYSWNYYQAFSPAGYYSPPFGENIAIFKTNQNGYGALQNGGCNNLTVSEYNEIFGIVSETAKDIDLSTSSLANNLYSILTPPQIVCPQSTPVPYFFDEINFSQIQGTTFALGAGTTFNDNPIPTSLDNFIYKVSSRYSLVEDSGYTQNNPIMDVVFQNGRAVPSYSSSTIEDKLNNTLCQAAIFETSLSANIGSNGQQLINAPDNNAPGDQTSFNNNIYPYFWNFLYKENAYSLPFNNFNSNPPSTPSATNSQLFNPILSSTDYFWKYRQCPSTVDFLPWTVGASIYAYPSQTFEIPYYATIKKFGFYGTRFLNTCNSLNLQYNIGNVPNASEIQTGLNQVTPPTLEPEGIDQAGNWNFSSYDNLLQVAQIEDNYSNFYAFNKGFFLWVNSGTLLNDVLYNSSIIQNSGFVNSLSNLYFQFSDVYTSGLYSLTGYSPAVLLQEGGLNSEFLVTATGSTTADEILLTNNVYQNFSQNAFPLLNQSQLNNWFLLENKYAYAVVNSDGSLNESFYQTIISGKQQRMRTRYFENLLRGNPIDLFPSNIIEFSTDQAKDYIENINWGRSISSFGANSTLPQINRRYFYGAYGQEGNIGNLETVLDSLVTSQDTYFYPGYFGQATCASDTISPSYYAVTGGLILDNKTRSFSTLGWLAIGYHEIGKLKGNFSCFTPIFVQQPVPQISCKIGQSPTFRCYAVDYHTIPEDKIQRGYPEIMYWAVKLKLLDCNNNYLYPMQYQWARIPIENYGEFIANPFANPNIIDYANSTGDWCCLEGNGEECTLIHPNLCFPTYTTGNQNYTFTKGAIYGQDDQYYYFSIASGRFGIRISDPSLLNIENWLAFDISLKNGANTPAQIIANFITQDYNGISHTINIPQIGKNTAAYQGYQFDNTQIPETAVRQKVPPPNNGYGDVTSYTFVGPSLYRGELRTFSPSYLNDGRGLYETWGKFIDYGPLVKFFSNLNQQQGDLLYGYNHLPTCTNYKMNNGQQGVKILFTYNGYNIQHYTIPQKAETELTNNYGIPYNGLAGIGNLYPPLLDPQNFAAGFDIGNGWQFSQNLGTIKRFGYSTKVNTNGTSSDITLGDAPFSNIITLSNVINYLKNNVLKPYDLAGDNCGYTPYGLGRYLGYYVESYDSFYILCNVGLKNDQNIQDSNFISPGYRMGNAAIQYNWLGKPYQTYLDRRELYGPYAYKWRVNNHNRDRNGNGYSEGFYSMGYETAYSLMYDLPAIFGLYVRTPNSSINYQNMINQVNATRSEVFGQGGYNMTNIRNISFGTIQDVGQEGARYGTLMWSCDPNTPFGGSITALCPYMTNSLALASDPNFSDYSCPPNILNQGNCFFPCLSQRYSHGFFPGGKTIDMFGNDNGKYNKIISMAKIENGNLINNEISSVDSNINFISPNNSPYNYYLKENMNNDFFNENLANGINPSSDYGSDFCNFNTPTIFLNNLFNLINQTTDFNYVSYNALQLFNGNSV